MCHSLKLIFSGASILLGLTACRTDTHQLAGQPTAPIANSAPVVEPVSFAERLPSDGTETTHPEALPLPDVGPPQLVEPAPLSGEAHVQRPLSLDEVVGSVRSHFPLIRQAAAGRGVASGEALAARGAFDHKLEAVSVSQPLDFFKNYRNTIGVKRETMWGGQTFAGYRIGRGAFEPWYLERETNKGGEFKLGVTAPIVRDRWIDANRATLWQAQLEQRRVEPEIMVQVIRSVRDGSVAYWDWVAAGANYRITEGLLKLAEQRNRGLKEQVKAQEKAAIDLVDNRRIIVSREATRIDSRRKLDQAAVKLSLFYRSGSGVPQLPDSARLPPGFDRMDSWQGAAAELPAETENTQVALMQRPELAEMEIVRQQLCIALRQAQNETWPDVDGGVLLAEDVGEPTSARRDKSELELEALVTVRVPVERRKAHGKSRSLRWKLAQLRAKQQFMAEKVIAEVRLARVALTAASGRVIRADEGFDLARQMQRAEQELFDQGQSTLFNLNIREQQAAVAAAVRVDALLEYYVAQADLTAAMGYETPLP